MAEETSAPAPELAESVLAPIPRAIGVRSGVGVAAAITIVSFWMTFAGGSSASHVPSRLEDLGRSVVTPVDPTDRDAVRAAIATLRTDATTRRHIAADIEAGRRRIGWIAVQDSMDPDGDTIAIESGGVVQQIVLAKAWVPVAVVSGADNRVGITALIDGEGGGITLALVTSGGPMPLRIMHPGEHIELATQ